MLSKNDKIPILLVDDDQIVLQHIRQLISWEELGYYIAGTALNGKQALTLYSSVRPRLILTDVIMPILNGIELIQEIKKKDSQCRFLILSSYDEFSYAKSAIQLGVTDYLLKTEITARSLTEKLLALKEEILLSDRSAAKYLSLDLQSYFRETASSAIHESSLLYPVRNRKYTFALFSVPSLFRKIIFQSPDQMFHTDIILSLTEKVSAHHHMLFFLLKHYVVLALPDGCSSQAFLAAARTIEAFLKEKYGDSILIQIDKTITISQMKRFLAKWESLLDYHLLFSERESLSFSALTEGLGNELKYVTLPSLQTLTTSLQKQTGKGYLQQIIKDVFAARDFSAAISLYRDLCALFQLETGQQTSAFSSEKEFFSWAQREYDRWNTPHSENKEALSYHVKNAILYIESHYMNAALSIEEISEQEGISSGRLGVLFKKELGKTPGEYLTDYRIQKAIHLLLHSNYKIFEIAGRVGYNSSQYFSQIFYSKTGKKPLDYRKSTITHITMGGKQDNA